MTSYSAPTQLLSEAQLLKRAGGRTAFVPGKGGSAGESSRKVGTGWNAIQPTTKPAQPTEKEDKVKVEIDDYEEDQEEVNMNPQRLNRGSRRPTATKSSASRWATVMTERPTPSTSTTPQPRPVPTRTASASRQPSGPPSPSQQKASQNGFKFAPAPAYALGRPPSQPGTRRGVQPTGRLPSRQNSMGGGTSASRWATATSASQDRKISNPAKPPPSASRPTPQKDLPPHVIAQPTPLPPKPQSQTPPRAPTTEIASLAKEPSPPPPIEPSTPDSFSQSVVPPDFSQPSIATTSTPPPAPAPVAVESKPSSPSPSPKPCSPSPISVPTPRAPSPALPPPVPVVESPALPVEATPAKEEDVQELPQLEKPVESENSEKARQEYDSSSTKISKLVSPMHLEQLSPPSSLKPSAASRALPPRSLLLPDRNRVSSGGARKEKKTPEELEALMAQMRLKNEAALLKRAKAEEDRRIFEELAEKERKASEELERKLNEERERKIREEKERKERTLELQKEINRSREEAAQRKLALIEGRAWDAEKLSKETRELQYPSFERRGRRESYDEGVEVVEDEEERRKRDGVRNDEGGWETVEHFEGKGRAQLVVKGKEKEENGIEV